MPTYRPSKVPFDYDNDNAGPQYDPNFSWHGEKKDHPNDDWFSQGGEMPPPGSGQGGEHLWRGYQKPQHGSPASPDTGQPFTAFDLEKRQTYNDSGNIIPSEKTILGFDNPNYTGKKSRGKKHRFDVFNYKEEPIEMVAIGTWVSWTGDGSPEPSLGSSPAPGAATGAGATSHPEAGTGGEGRSAGSVNRGGGAGDGGGGDTGGGNQSSPPTGRWGAPGNNGGGQGAAGDESAGLNTGRWGAPHAGDESAGLNMGRAGGGQGHPAGDESAGLNMGRGGRGLAGDESAGLNTGRQGGAGMAGNESAGLNTGGRKMWHDSHSVKALGGGGGGAYGGEAPAGSSNPRLAKQRSGFFNYMDTHPQAKEMFTKAALAEGGKRGLQTNYEQMMNYGNARNFRTSDQIIHSGFFGPVNRGAAQRHQITADERRASDAALGKVRGGSNVLDYRTDQGMAGDKNYAKEHNPYYRPKVINGNFFADHPMFDKPGGSWAQRQKQADAAAGIPSGGARIPEASSGTGSPPAATGGAGKAEFPHSGSADFSHVNPTLLDRTNQMYRAAPDYAKRGFQAVSGYRSPALQAKLYNNYKSGRGGIAAPPGHSMHDQGRAIDIQDKSDWFHRHSRDFGLHFPLGRKDYPHMQMVEDTRGGHH